jgi:DNA repair exonuclease SbcCD ATPase subunit
LIISKQSECPLCKGELPLEDAAALVELREITILAKQIRWLQKMRSADLARIEQAVSLANAVRTYCYRESEGVSDYADLLATLERFDEAMETPMPEKPAD